MGCKEDAPGRGWFKIAGQQDGERSPKEQLKGLHPLLDRVRGMSVLDLGAAEGLISLWLIQAGGAKSAVCVESVQTRCDTGAAFCAGHAVEFRAESCEFPATTGLPRADVVLALSIAHKFADPARFLKEAASLARHYIAVRTPAPIINDPRSGNKPIDVRAVLTACGFAPYAHTFDGPRGEWVGIFDRIPWARPRGLGR